MKDQKVMVNQNFLQQKIAELFEQNVIECVVKPMRVGIWA